MAGSDDLIDFSVIESHKENIRALPSGRSAKALAQLYSPPLQQHPSTFDAHTAAREPFERELAAIAEADDPLDVYDRYVAWTLATYPSAQATPQSRLLPLLERATTAFQSHAHSHYHDDPRYLRLWLHYIRLFADAPREVFAFLARHRIGVGLALYYEEFAAWLENAGRWSQAEEVYRLGVERGARPAERLARKFAEFQRRREARPPTDEEEPTSPALPIARPALAAKGDSYGTSSSVVGVQQQHARSTAASKKGKNSKLAIFSDADESASSSRPGSGGSAKGWDSIGSLAERKKENAMEAKPWAGERLKGTGKTNGSVPKLMVYKDESLPISPSFSKKRSIVTTNSSSLSSSLPSHIQRALSGINHEQQCARNPRSGRIECVFVNLEAVYPDAPGARGPRREYCFEELRARHRGWLDKVWDLPESQQIDSAPTSQMNRDLNHDEQLPSRQKDVDDGQPDFHVDESKAQTGQSRQREFKIFEDAAVPQAPPLPVHANTEEKVPIEIFSHNLVLSDENDENAPPPASNHLRAQQQQEQQLQQPPQRHQQHQRQPDAPSDLVKKMRRDERQNRTRKIQVMDVKHIKNETRTIQLNLDSPTGPKRRPKKTSSSSASAAAGATSEPTMTINTREAIEEIYGIFNQPLPSQVANEDDGEESADEGDEEDDEYTTGDESTATGKLSTTTSEIGEETRNEILKGADTRETMDGKDETAAWSDFTRSKHVPESHHGHSEHQYEGRLIRDLESTQSSGWDMDGEDASRSTDRSVIEEEPEPITTPYENGEEEPHTRYVTVPPEDYEPSIDPFRELQMVPNHRLPFMTPIVERTESSLGAATGIRTAEGENEFNSRQNPFGRGGSTKTPSRKIAAAAAVAATASPADAVKVMDDGGDELCNSSPFQEGQSEERAEARRRVLQPIRTKTTRGTISLGAGTAKAQIAARARPTEEQRGENRGPIILDQRCNPMDPQVRQTILARVCPPLTTYEGYFDHSHEASGRTPEVRKYIRSLQKATGSGGSAKAGCVNVEKTGHTLNLPPMLSFPGAHGTYAIKRELGAGTFAPVYLVENRAVSALDELDEDHERPSSSASRTGIAPHRKALEAIKMEDPPSTWEFYMLRQVHYRLGAARAAESVVRAHEMHLFRDECFLVEEFRGQGTLLDLVNLARVDVAVGGGSSSSGGIDEALAMWFAVELLRTVEALHSRQLIHGDLKPDNVLVRFDEPGPEMDWSATYFASGAHGWACKGVCLIDFGRGVDVRAFAPDAAFVADWATSAADCAEMRELRPWTYQVDYHGLAGVVHSLLFGKYMETLAEKSGGATAGALPSQGGGTKTYRIRESLKRYWQTELWQEFFALMLNPLAHTATEEGGRLPVVRGMRAVREHMESWLEENAERGIGLKGMISRLEAAIRERRRKSGRMGGG